MVDTLHIDDRISVPIDEIELSAVRSSGSGGQNVNKVATAIHLRFDAGNSAYLPEDVKRRLVEMGDHRVTADGVIVIKAQETRSQARNREAALDRLADLLRAACHQDRERIPTRPSKKAKARRMDAKRRRANVKSMRQRPRED
jgi:ribosome-associated protein